MPYLHSQDRPTKDERLRCPSSEPVKCSYGSTAFGIIIVVVLMAIALFIL